MTITYAAGARFRAASDLTLASPRFGESEMRGQVFGQYALEKTGGTGRIVETPSSIRLAHLTWTGILADDPALIGELEGEVMSSLWGSSLVVWIDPDTHFRLDPRPIRGQCTRLR